MSPATASDAALVPQKRWVGRARQLLLDKIWPYLAGLQVGMSPFLTCLSDVAGHPRRATFPYPTPPILTAELPGVQPGWHHLHCLQGQRRPPFCARARTLQGMCSSRLSGVQTRAAQRLPNMPQRLCQDIYWPVPPEHAVTDLASYPCFVHKLTEANLLSSPHFV